MRVVLILLAAALPFAALAHVPEPAAPVASLWQWNLAPWLLALLAVSAAGYGLGLRRLWGQAGRGRGVSTWQAWAFATGWLAVVGALVSPLDPLGGRLFSAHMVQHELLMVVAAPLLVVGRPLATWTWALSPSQRRTVGRLFQVRGWASLWTTLTDPLVAWALHALVLWGWHIPGAFDAALENEALHILQHASFLVTALFFWWAVLGHDPRGRYGPGHSAAYLFTTMMHTAALGALLSLSPTAWYAPYIPRTAALGFDPVDDQQLGGLVMWVPAGMAYIVAALWVLGGMLTRTKA
ncbi:cytochrome c oxidase assembly protein [Ramlibacter sp. USB13]|uniref:Cytochrome c oxidase assembly protein n=1 Tax=Ramlibacter cellulosilyticus TaxID=2764187 RepID=A0A923SDS7_9BURK|nr:cytochrome c oxidase assembly protein [Ramlibacter cellulosilyticus]MBC5786340.1 cytochrome c oxidase assembly protein [Ramlibacter cellulosilyticus]